MYYEYAGTPADGIAPFTEAASRKMWWWCQENGCTNDTAAVLNYIGTRQVMRDRYNAFKYEGESLLDQTNPSFGPGRFSTAVGIAQNAIDNPAWKSGEVGYDVPWDWGNLSMFPKPKSVWRLMEQSERSLAVNAVVYLYGSPADVESGDAFVIVTYNQERYWKNYP